MIGNVFFGDQRFLTPGQGYSLPQEPSISRTVNCSNYFFTFAAAASTAQSFTILNAVNPQSSFLLMGLQLDIKCLSNANAVKTLDFAAVNIFGASVDLSIPYVPGLVPTVSSTVLTAQGNPQNKEIKVMFGDGINVNPNQGLTLTITAWTASALLITDTINGTVKLYWS